MSKSIKIVCDNKVIEVSKENDDILMHINYKEIPGLDGFDVLLLTKEEASYLIGALEHILGRKSSLEPKERTHIDTN